MKQLPLDHFLNYRHISNLRQNKNKTKSYFAVSKTNYEKNQYTYDLYQTDGLRQRRIKRLGKSSSFIVENNDTILIPFAKTKEEKALKKQMYSIYYRYNVLTKKQEHAYTFSLPFEILEVIDENHLLLKGYFEEEILMLKDLDNNSRKEEVKKYNQNKLYEDINQIPFYLNGPGFTANKYNNLFIYNTITKQTIRVNSADVNVGNFKINKDKNEIIYIGSMKKEVMQPINQIYLYNYKTGENKTLYNKDDYNIKFVEFLDDFIVCYASDMQKLGINQNGSFYLLKDNNLTLINDFPTSVGNSIGSDVRLGSSPLTAVYNNKLYFVSTVDDHSEIYSLNKDNNIKLEYLADGSIDGISFINNKLIAVMLYKQRLQEIYEINLDTNSRKRITQLNNKYLSSYYIAKPKEVIVKYSSHEVKGFILEPKDYDPNKRYPAILNIHGGPKTVYGKVYYHEMQVWANMGYFVFFANPRGSDGKGDEFSDIRGKYGTIDYKDLMAFTNQVLKKYNSIDQENLFVTGGSYGGFMTNWIVGQTNRFKAAVTQRSITNWISFFGTSDIGYYFANDQTKGHPLSDLNKLWEQSPLKYAANIKTPLLFIHADKDYRCPISQAIELYVLLKERNIPTKLIWFKDENHDLSRSGKPQARVKRLKEITNWFKKYTN